MKDLKYSRAQNFEDIILHRALKDVKKGFYIDVGANDPEVDSVTCEFYRSGWKGVNIEPVDEFYEKLCSNRPHDINLKVCASSIDDENIDLLTVAGTGLSTSALGMKDDIKKLGFNSEVTNSQSLTLNSVWDKYIDSKIVHFLKIDVEGMELNVLQGIDFSKYRPWIIVVEAVSPIEMKPSHRKWQKLITDHDYRFVYFDGLNRFYLAGEQKRLASRFKAPPNISDELFHSVVRIRNEYAFMIDKQNKFEKEMVETSEKFLLENQTQLVENKKLHEKVLSLTEKNVKDINYQQELKQQLHASNIDLVNIKRINDNANLNIRLLKEKNKDLDSKCLEFNQLLHQAHSESKKINLQLHEAYIKLEEITNSGLWVSTYPYRKARHLLRTSQSRFKKAPKLIIKTIVYLCNHGLKKTIFKVRDKLRSTELIVQNTDTSQQRRNVLSQGEQKIYEIIKRN